MKVERKEFRVALQAAGHVDAKIEPMVGDFLLSSRDGVLSVRGVDFETDVVWRLKAEGDGFSDVVLPRMLQGFVAELPDDALELALSGNVMAVIGNRQKGTFSVKAPEMFPPTVKVEGPEFKVDADLIVALDRVIVATSTEDTRPVLSGVLFEPGETVLRLAAADGFRLAVDEVVAVCTGPSFIVPLKAMKILKRLVSDGDLTVRTDKGHVAFHGEKFDLVSQLIQGTYPEYSKLIPTGFKSTVIADRRELKRCIRSVCTLGGKIPMVRLEIREKDLLVSIPQGDDVDKVEATVDVVLTGEPVKIAFDKKYLAEGLDAIPGDKVKMEITCPTSPARLTGDGKYQYVIMPMYATW